jgi:hypothetical protein
LTRTRQLGWLFATVPVSAGILAAARLVPLYERLALWIVPALYVGIALLLDGSLRILVQRSRQRLSSEGLRHRRRETVSVAVAVLGVTAVALLSGDLVARGIDDLRRGRPAGANHRLDDRTAVRWLMGQLRPGDVLLTTRLALPALWWYGEMPISHASGAGSVSPAGVPILELRYEPAGPRCDHDRLGAQLRAAQRALVFYGFRFDDVPMAFDGVLLQELSGIGTVARFETFAGASRAAIVDLHAGRSTDAEVTAAAGAGCILARPARMW